MTTIVLPIAGRSSRFPNVAPKWSLRGPSGSMLRMAVAGMSGIGTTADSVLIVGISEYRDLVSAVAEELRVAYPQASVQVSLLEETPPGQALTVANGLRDKAVTGPIFIKDCDNTFCLDVLSGGNYVAVGDMNEERSVTPWNKSYVLLDSSGNLAAIAERTILSANFCVGGYAFDSAETFVSETDRIKTLLDAHDSRAEVYPSTVICNRLLAGDLFKTRLVYGYRDWGTLEDWSSYLTGES